MTDEELVRIVEAVKKALVEGNPAFVRTDLCEARYGWIKKAVLGLYAFIGAIAIGLFVAVLAK